MKKHRFGFSGIPRDIPRPQKNAKKICGSISMMPDEQFFRIHEMANQFQILAAWNCRLSKKRPGVNRCQPFCKLRKKHGKLPKWADKLVRLIYMGHADGNETIRSAITMLNDMDRVLNRKIVFEETESGWRESLQKETVAAWARSPAFPGGLITGICSSHIAYDHVAWKI